MRKIFRTRASEEALRRGEAFAKEAGFPPRIVEIPRPPKILDFEKAADALAIEVAKLIRDKIIDSRSPAADALLDYKGGKFFGEPNE